MSKSIKRVEKAAQDLGLAIAIRRMGSSTRTADDAACGCGVERIVKSLVFRGGDSDRFILLLVSGANRVDPARVEPAVGEPLARADAADVRRHTGFAIGGVAPFGHLNPARVWIDETLLAFPTVWAAAGAPDAVFEVDPALLAKAIGAKVATLA